MKSSTRVCLIRSEAGILTVRSSSPLFSTKVRERISDRLPAFDPVTTGTDREPWTMLKSLFSFSELRRMERRSDTLTP